MKSIVYCDNKLSWSEAWKMTVPDRRKFMSVIDDYNSDRKKAMEQTKTHR